MPDSHIYLRTSKLVQNLATHWGKDANLAVALHME